MQGLVQLFKFMFHYLHFALNNGFSSLMKRFIENWYSDWNDDIMYILALSPTGGAENELI